jgi:tRNA-dihydrouridine synthase 4
MSILDLFQQKSFAKIAAPMVRYSKVPFRLTCLDFGVDIVYTPMIMSDSFLISKKARDVEFQHIKGDSPLVVQFGSNDAVSFGKSSHLVSKYCDAVNLNCGCPQRWALEDGIGAGMLNTPQLIFDCVKTARNMTGDTFPISVKIRIDDSLKRTVDLAMQLEKTGAR